MIYHNNFLYIIQSQKHFKTFVGYILKWPTNIILVDELNFDIFVDKENNMLKEPTWNDPTIENILNKKRFIENSIYVEERNQQLYKEFK